MTTRRTARVTRRVVFHVLMILACAVVLYPALWMVVSAFKPGDQILSSPSL